MTDTPKHTPGPWKLNDEKNGENIIVPANAKTGDETCIAMALEADDRDWAETMSNARLIAAAPELFSLLQRIVKEQCGICSFQYGMNANCETCLYGEARTLIAKAKGEPNP